MTMGFPSPLPPVTGRGESRRFARQQNADKIMQHIAELLPPDYHGIYAREMIHAEPPAPDSQAFDLHPPDDAQA